MEINNAFEVKAPIDVAWATLTDLARTRIVLALYRAIRQQMYAPRRATWAVLCEKTDSDYFLRALETRAEPERRFSERRQMIRDLDEQFAGQD